MNSNRRPILRRLVATVAAALTLTSIGSGVLGEGVAHAGPNSGLLWRSNSVLYFYGGPTANNIEVTRDATSYTFQDISAGAEILTAAPCVSEGRAFVRCPATGITGVAIFGEGGSDRILGSAGADIVDGGAGNDTIWARAGNDDLQGGDGADFLFGEAGTDKLDGGSASTNDRDSMSGGADRDWVTYLAKGAAVSVTLDNLGNDGVIGANEGDFVGSDVEDVTGTRYDDVLVGADNVDNRLYGTWGNDTILGGSGSDWLYGELGRDSLFGGVGTDRLHQRYGSATVSDVDAISDCGGEPSDILYKDANDSGTTGCRNINPA